MNRPPEIIVNSGYITDVNGVLTELVIPSNVKTIRAPSVLTINGAETITWLPSTATALTVVNSNVPTLTGAIFAGFTALTTVNMPELKSLTNTNGSGGNYSGMFRGCANLTTVNMPKLESIAYNTTAGGGGAFYGCTGLTSLSFPNLLSITSNAGNYGGASGGVFAGCSALSSVSMPQLATIIQDEGGGGTTNGLFANCSSLTSLTLESLNTITVNGNTSPFPSTVPLTTVSFPKISVITANWQSGGCFSGCTTLTSVTFGSVGNPVTGLGNRTFYNCTQTGLTITIYTQGGAALSGSPWGATNATIEYEEA